MRFHSHRSKAIRQRAVAAADTRSDEPAFIVYTSGTTGKPKGIVHAHRWIVALGDLNRYRLPPQENDVVMATGEWSFISALGHNLLFPLRNGVTGAILPGRATPENVLAAVEKYKVTVLHCVATVYRRLLAMPGFEKQHDLTSLRCSALDRRSFARGDLQGMETASRFRTVRALRCLRIPARYRQWR